MNTMLASRRYDLEDRTYAFAEKVRIFVRKLSYSTSNIEDGKQLVRSSGSVGANYIEANEAVSRNDFIHKIKICRKEAKESRFWLRLVNVADSEQEKLRMTLMQEALELERIFGATVRKMTISATQMKKSE